MSVKIKMILGFVIILVMVMGQSYLIVSMNGKRDVMSQQALTLFQMNLVMKDRVIELKTLENDLLNLILTKQPVQLIAKGSDSSNALSCAYLYRSLSQWHDAFLSSGYYGTLNDALKQKIMDMKPYLSQIGESIKLIGSISPDRVEERRKIFDTGIRQPVLDLQNLAQDFVGQNSQFFSATNQSLLSYSSDMERNQMIIIGVALLLIVFIIVYAQHLLQPLNWLMAGVNSIRKGDIAVKVRKRGNDELGRLAEQFNVMADEIRSHREHLEELVLNRTQQLLEAKEALEKTNDDLVCTNHNLEDARRIMDLDMKMAINVQLSFFMKRPPRSEQWEIAFAFLPMNGVAGDLYDFYTDRSGKITGASLMDVSGHGIASGLITMIAKSVIFRNFAKYSDIGLNRVVEMINDDLIMELNNVDNYLTGIILRFSENMVEYVNAGHPELLVRRGGTNSVVVVEPDDGRSYKGYFLGLEAMKMPFRQITFPMRKDDTILMFSDCLIESKNSAGEEHGLQAVMRSFSGAEGAAGDIVHCIVNDLRAFTGSQKLNDDLTIIAIRRLV